jgi:four helix bundle protein
MGKKDILDRCFKYSLEIIKIYMELEKSNMGRIIGKQLLRAGTSVGANVNEAQSGQSRADFVSKMYIAYKEARESSYWLRLIIESKILYSDGIKSLLCETEQLIKILASIIASTKRKAKELVV